MNEVSLILRSLWIVGLVVSLAIALLGGWIALSGPRLPSLSASFGLLLGGTPAALAGVVFLLGTIAFWSPRYASIVSGGIGGGVLLAPNLVTLVFLAREDAGSLLSGWSSADSTIVLWVLDNVAGWAIGTVLFALGPAPWWTAPPVFVGAVLLRRHRDRVIPSAFQASVRRDQRARDPYRQSEKLSAYVAPVGGLCLSACGRWLAIAGGEREGTIQLWDLDTERRLWILGGVIGARLTAPPAISPDGRWVAARVGAEAVIIDAHAGVVARTLARSEERPGQDRKALAMAFSADSKTLVAADENLRVITIDGTNPDVSFSLERDGSDLCAIALHPGGRFVWIGTRVENVRRVEAWDLVARARVLALRGAFKHCAIPATNEPPPDLLITRDGTRLITVDPEIREVSVWNAEDGKRLSTWRTRSAGTRPMALLDGDRKVLLLVWRGGYEVLDLETGEHSGRNAPKYQVVASPADGRFAVLGRGSCMAIGDRTKPTISIERGPWRLS